MNSRLSIERKLSDAIKAEAASLGFYRCGIAEAAPVDGAAAARLASWLRSGLNAGMDYMARHTDLRLDPRLLMPGARSIVCVAMAYAPAVALPKDGYTIAAYAMGRDYHDVMKARLRQLAAAMERLLAESDGPQPPDGQPPVETRVCCDTAPVLERYWAARAGLGWTGRNTQLVIPGAGSMFFLGEVLVNRTLLFDSPLPPRCGTCRACIDACPTCALSADGALDARRCLSYLTIENRGEIPPQAARAMGNTIYGCDRCQAACPWNRFAPAATVPELRPNPELLRMSRADWSALTVDGYRRLFKGSAVKRAKYDGLMRNIKAVEGNAVGTENTATGKR